jgi:HAD superfamily hydrolase (TIGR01509 family)
MLEALIFDVDGTVAETEDLHRRAFNLAFGLHEVELAWDVREYRRLLRVHGGRERITRALAELGGHRPPGELAAIHASKTRFYAMLLGCSATAWRPGVRRLMDEAQQAGLGVALATTTTQANLEPLFTPVLGAGWRARFAAIVAGNMVPRKKPAPDVYVEALRLIGVRAQRALAFEDSTAGVEAARGAGVAVVATPSAWLAGDDLSSADLVVEHLGDPNRLWDECHPRLRQRWVTMQALSAWHGQRSTACSPRT